MICRGFCDGPHGVLGDEADSILDYEESKPGIYVLNHSLDSLPEYQGEGLEFLITRFNL